MHEINISEIHAEVSEAFQRYEQALVSNDVAMLDALFWQSPFTLRYGAGENLYGYEAIQAFRKQRSTQGLERTLSQTVITTFGRDFATANTLFHRAGQAATGRQSHTWVRMAEGWRIVSAHVSLMNGSGQAETRFARSAGPTSLPVAGKKPLRNVRKYFVTGGMILSSWWTAGGIAYRRRCDRALQGVKGPFLVWRNSQVAGTNARRRLLGAGLAIEGGFPWI